MSAHGRIEAALLAVAALSASSSLIACTTCERTVLDGAVGPGSALAVETRLVVCGGHRGLHIAMVDQRRSSREERVFFRLLLPTGYPLSGPGRIASVEWESASELIIRYPADLRPAQRDARVFGIEVRYEAEQRP